MKLSTISTIWYFLFTFFGPQIVFVFNQCHHYSVINPFKEMVLRNEYRKEGYYFERLFPLFSHKQVYFAFKILSKVQDEKSRKNQTAFKIFFFFYSRFYFHTLFLQSFK